MHSETFCCCPISTTPTFSCYCCPPTVLESGLRRGHCPSSKYKLGSCCPLVAKSDNVFLCICALSHRRRTSVHQSLRWPPCQWGTRYEISQTCVLCSHVILIVSCLSELTIPKPKGLVMPRTAFSFTPPVHNTMDQLGPMSSSL